MNRALRLAVMIGALLPAVGAVALPVSTSAASLRGRRLPPTVAPLSHPRSATHRTMRAAIAVAPPAGTTVAVGQLPTGVAVTNARAYVADARGNSLSVVDLTSRPIAVVATVPVGSFPSAVALSPDGSTAYVANFQSGTISIVDTASRVVSHTVTVGSEPDGIVQIGALVYVANFGAGTISVVDPVAATVVATITLPGSQPAPSGLAAGSGGSRLYVDDARNSTTTVIDLTHSPAVVDGSAAVGTYPAYLSVVGTSAFVANGTKGAVVPGTVSVVDVSSATSPVTTHTIAVGSHPYGIAAIPSLGEALVSNSGSRSVTVLDTINDSVLTTLAVGSTPDAVAVTPDQTTAVVSNEGDNTISVIPVTGFRTLVDQTSGALAEATNSQNYESTYDAYDDQAADDFQVSPPPSATGWRIAAVVADGLYANQTPPGPASSFNVVLYQDDPVTHLPGTVVFQQANIAQVANDPTGDVTLPLSPAPALPAGHYWLSVQANENFSLHGSWNWDDRAPQTLSAAVFEQPGQGSGPGCSTWTLRSQCIGLSPISEPDQAFALIGGYQFPTPAAAAAQTQGATTQGATTRAVAEPRPAPAPSGRPGSVGRSPLVTPRRAAVSPHVRTHAPAHRRAHRHRRLRRLQPGSDGQATSPRRARR